MPGKNMVASGVKSGHIGSVGIQLQGYKCQGTKAHYVRSRI